MFTEKFLEKAGFVKDLYSVRISLYGTNESQYENCKKKINLNLLKIILLI